MDFNSETLFLNPIILQCNELINLTIKKEVLLKWKKNHHHNIFENQNIYLKSPSCHRLRLYQKLL